MNTTLVTSPNGTESWLVERVQQANNSILIIAPYVGGVLENLLSRRAGALSTRLITSLKISDVITKATNLECIYRLSTQKVRVCSISNLHAKVYLVDDHHALVTSANPTQNGWRNNVEMGLSVQSATLAAQIREVLRQANPQPWTTKELRRYAEWAKTQAPKKPKTSVFPWQIVKGAFGGWLEMTISVLEHLPEEFTLAQAYEVLLPLAATHYPNNRHPRDKIRQQLQLLRDLGLVDFVTPGQYRQLDYIAS